MNIARPSIIWVATLTTVIIAVVLLREMLLPFVAAMALAYLLDPLVNRLEHIGVNRTVAALGIIGLFYLGVVGVVAVAAPVLGAEIAALIDKLPEYIGKLQAFSDDPTRPWLRKIIGEGLSEVDSAGLIPRFLRSIWLESQTLVSILSLLIITPIVTLYLLNDWRRLIAAIDHLIPAAQRETVWALAGEIDDTIAGYLRGQGTICLILGIYYAFALHLMGLSHGILIGLACGLFSFVPYLGAFTGIAVSIFVVVLQFWPNWTLIPVVVGIFVVGQAIADYVLAPYLIASRIHLSPVWVIFAIAAFGYLFGFVGLLIAVPIAAAIGVVVRFAARQLSDAQHSY